MHLPVLYNIVWPTHDISGWHKSRYGTCCGPKQLSNLTLVNVWIWCQMAKPARKSRTADTGSHRSCEHSALQPCHFALQQLQLIHWAPRHVTRHHYDNSLNFGMLIQNWPACDPAACPWIQSFEWGLLQIVLISLILKFGVVLAQTAVQFCTVTWLQLSQNTL